MPRIRTIKPKFWDDIKLSKISRDARLLFIGIWNFSDDLGVFVADADWVKSKVFPYDKFDPELLEKWMQELVTFRFIQSISYNDEKFYHIRTFKTHQRIDKPNNDDIFIPKELLTNILEQSRINRGIIQETSNINPISIQGGKDSIGKDSIGKEADSQIYNGFSFIVPEMMKIWQKFKPDYPSDQERDFPYLRKISEFILAQPKTKIDKTNTDQEKVLISFEIITKFCCQHDFYKNHNIAQVEKYIQSIVTSIQNGNTKNGKQPTGSQVSTQSAFGKIDEIVS